MNKPRVAITGIGLITPLGKTVDEFWTRVVSGQSGIGLIDRFDTSGYPTRMAAQVPDFAAENYLPRKEARRMDLSVQFACSAALLAVEDAKLKLDPREAERCGVWVGSGIGGIATLESNHQGLLERGVAAISPFFVPMIIPNMVAGQISILLKAQGPCGCTVTACATGTNCIGEAMRFIQMGKADIMLAGGSEAAITPLAMGGFCAMKAMSTRNDDPQAACRPFDRDRDGFVMGEGACVLVLEEWEHARERGARIYAELCGYGTSADAFNVVQPDPEAKGPARALALALDDAGISPQEVDYINAHGTGTYFNDVTETRAIKMVFADHSLGLAISSTKPLTGHMLGAGGAVELAVTVLALRDGIIPPTINLDHPDPDCDLDYVPGEARRREIRAALSNSMGFGGHNAALVVRKVLTDDAAHE